MSIVAIILTVTVPITHFINSMYRPRGMNEFELLVSQLEQGALLSIFVLMGYLYLLLWGFYFYTREE